MQLKVIKIGGNIIENETALEAFLTDFATIEGPKILVHGGGKLATQLAEKLGIETQMVEGRRITDAETLKVIIMVYGGFANKTIVAKLQAKDCNAIGLSGADGNAITAVKRPVKTIDYGFVGDIESVNSKTISALLESGLTPVFCAISHDGNGQLFNTNADTIASTIATGMSSLYDVALYYCFEKNGVMKDINDDDSVIEHINAENYQKLLDDKIIIDGMIPKLHNAFEALKQNVSKVCIGNTKMILEKEGAKHTTITL
ncbi:N-acetylglutamate kinase [Pustulibacterium marinum]|uniref:Acetylglutamate kinase n=1 Tax=Pustulibacterium marinum TaxID=1224947 RepID=A0A1I7FNX5_9FLAO|nr:acetylglutamate kinase [Pustulibacterium marinum]SFU37884.1 N-acetylglutamate kinase [Pustulibacterium marinum]